LNVLFNGKLVSDLVLPASGDPGRNGWLLGDGIFETLKSIDGKIWALSHHLDRAYKSGAILGFALPIRSDVEVGMQKLLEATKEIEHGRIRITFLSNGDWVATHKVLELSSNELSVVDYQYPKNENSILAGIKTLSYGENAHALRVAHSAGADDVIFKNLAGNVAESAVANVLWESDGKFFTPPLSSGCLPGITRGFLIGYFGVAERDITPADLQNCRASYLLSSAKGIRPINRYNNTENQSSANGAKLISEFNDWVWSKLQS